MGRIFVDRRHVATGLIVSLHLLAAAWLWWRYERGHADSRLLLASAVPVAQVTLLAVWAAMGRMWIGLRLSGALLLATAAWCVDCRVLAFESSDHRTAAHAIMVAVQFMLIVAVIGSARILAWSVRRPLAKPPSPPIQFGLVSVLVWMLGVGIVLGVWRFILSGSGWTIDTVRSEFLLYGAAVGVGNAVLGLLIVTAVLWGRKGGRILAQVIAALLLVGGLLWIQQVVLETIFARLGNMSRVAWLTQGGCQAAILLFTLAPIRRAAYNDQRCVHMSDQEEGASHAG